MAQARELFADYCSEFQNVGQFFRYNPRNLKNALGELRATRQARFDGDQLQEIKLYNEKTGCGEKTLENIDRLGEDGTAAVVTGQQAGIFTGPLYTIYKALTAIKLAHHITDRFGVIAVPIFWNASEDHDFQEVRHVEFVSRDDRVLSLVYEPKADIDAKSIFDVPLEPSLEFLIGLMEGDTNESEFKHSIIDLLRNSLGRCYSLADWFSCLMQALFNSYGLVMIDPHLPPWRRLASPIIEREIENPLQSSHLINETGQQLRELGYRQQIMRKEDDVNFFFYAQGRRNKVRFQGAKFLVNRVGLEYDKTEMMDMLAKEPERFSPGAALRPLVQDHVLPTVAYIAGPGEVSYFAQMRDTYSFFDLVMPVIYPRRRAMLIEAGIAKILDRYGLDVEDVRKSRKDLIRLIVSRGNSHPIVRECDRKLGAMEEVLDEFRREVAETEPTLAEPIDKLKQKIGYEMDKIRQKLVLAQENELDIIEQHVDRLRTHLFPEGKEQERVLNIFPYLFTYGIQLIAMLEKAIDIMDFERQTIHV